MHNHDDTESSELFLALSCSYRDQQTPNRQHALRLEPTRRFKSIVSIAADCRV